MKLPTILSRISAQNALSKCLPTIFKHPETEPQGELEFRFLEAVHMARSWTLYDDDSYGAVWRDREDDAVIMADFASASIKQLPQHWQTALRLHVDPATNNGLGMEKFADYLRTAMTHLRYPGKLMSSDNGKAVYLSKIRNVSQYSDKKDKFEVNYLHYVLDERTGQVLNTKRRQGYLPASLLEQFYPGFGHRARAALVLGMKPHEVARHATGSDDLQVQPYTAETNLPEMTADL